MRLYAVLLHNFLTNIGLNDRVFNLLQERLP